MPRAKRTRHDPILTRDQLVSEALSELAAVPAALVPAYNMADLPLAADVPNGIVIVKDDPQGLATSVLVEATGQWRWRSEVDASDLGPGNATGT